MSQKSILNNLSYHFRKENKKKYQCIFTLSGGYYSILTLSFSFVWPVSLRVYKLLVSPTCYISIENVQGKDEQFCSLEQVARFVAR